MALATRRRITKPTVAKPPTAKSPTAKPPTRPGSPSVDDLLDELQAVASAPPIYDDYFPAHPPQRFTTATAPFESLDDEGISIIPPLRKYSGEPILPSIVPTLQLEFEIPFEGSMFPHSFTPVPILMPTFTLNTDLRLCPESKYVESKPPVFEGITVRKREPVKEVFQTIAHGVYHHPELSKEPPSASELSALIRWDLIKDPDPRRQPCEDSPKDPKKRIVVPVISSGTPAGVPGYEVLSLKRKRKVPGPVERNMFGEEAENPWKKQKREVAEKAYVPWATSSTHYEVPGGTTRPVSYAQASEDIVMA